MLAEVSEQQSVGGDPLGMKESLTDGSAGAIPRGALVKEGAIQDAPAGRAQGSEEELHAQEDVREVGTIKAPYMPTQEEVDLHRLTHCQYRSWCPECVEAFGREWPHKQRSEERGIPLVSLDYLYLSGNGVFA